MSSDRIPGQRFAESPRWDQSASTGSGGMGGANPSGSGNTPQDHRKIQQYHSSGKALPVVLGVVALVVVAVIVYLAVRTQYAEPAQPSATPSSSASPTRFYTPSPGTEGTPFGNSCANATGIWEITSSQWDSQGVTITTRIQVDTGSLTFEFSAFDNTTADYFEPEQDSTLAQGTIKAGNTRTGTVRFEKSQGDTNVMLTSQRGTCSVATLTVKG